MPDEDETLLEFPCEYTIKVLGRETPDFAMLVQSIIEQHVEPCSRVERRPSRKGRFVSVNATFTADSLEQLHSIHQALRASGCVTLIL